MLTDCRAAPRVGRNSLALEDKKARNQSSPSKSIACQIRNGVGGKYAYCCSVSRVGKNSLTSKMEKLDGEEEGKARGISYSFHSSADRQGERFQRHACRRSTLIDYFVDAPRYSSFRLGLAYTIRNEVF